MGNQIVVKKCLVSLPEDGGGEREREREIDRYREIAVFTCPDSRLEP